MKVLCIILSLPESLKPACWQSVLNQKLPQDTTVTAYLITEKSNKPTSEERIPDALNRGLEKRKIRLADYDYMLRMDGDTILGSTFLKTNLAAEPDVMGNGFAHLIKLKTFLEVMPHGRYTNICDDAYLNARFKWYGKKVYNHYLEEPLASGGHHKFDPEFHINRGRMLYMLGWTPIHVLSITLQDIGDWYKTIFEVANYFLCFLLRPTKFDVSDFVRKYQVHSELEHLKAFNIRRIGKLFRWR